jgi:hypothetical protein
VKGLKKHLRNALLGSSFAALISSLMGVTLAEQNEALFREMQAVHGLSDERMTEIREIFSRSGYIGQGNPAITKHPATPAECREKLAGAGVSYANPRFEAICGGPFMAPLYDPSRETPERARACIDQFEFPDVPCAFPVVWVRAREAAQLCEAMGKRLCDAHEWEGGCAGALTSPDYRFDLVIAGDASASVARMRQAHNRANEADKSWSYGREPRKGICGAASSKDAACNGGSWTQCGSNTYPAGFFPDCRSALQVYDLHGNAAEHMNLPLSEDQMASRGSRTLGFTEMKGSWFIFDKYRAHEDWCRWRAPYWHGSRVMDANSHRNYHLGFRCCRTVSGEGTGE